MRKLIGTLFLSIAICVGSVGVSAADDLDTSIPPICKSTLESSIEDQKFCLQKYLYFRGAPLHPNIIGEFDNGVADRGVHIVSLNLADLVGSNRACCGWVHLKTYKGMRIRETRYEDGQGYAGYTFMGAANNGVLLVDFYSNSGGTLSLRRLFMLSASEEIYFRGEYTKTDDWDALKDLTQDKRIHLKLMGAILLGSTHSSPDIELDGDYLVLDGQRIKIPDPLPG
jgi:hypothetical protein